MKRIHKPLRTEPWPTWAIEGLAGAGDNHARVIMEMLLGLRQRLVYTLQIRWDDDEDSGFHVVHGKTGPRLWVPATDRLRTCLDAMPRSLTTFTADPASGKQIDRHRAQMILERVQPLPGARHSPGMG